MNCSTRASLNLGPNTWSTAAAIPRTIPVPRAIRLQVGKQQKSLEIFGDRQWSMGIPGDPAMLDPLRICWQHAFGGAGHPYNPLGKGYNPAPKGPVSLPNILSPNRGADPQNAELLPAGLTAYPPDSPLRTQFYGAFDKAWLRDTWPAVPTDSKPEIFMTAPDDQWLPDFFQGGEAVYIEGMHPEHRFQETTLPRLRARIFARKKGESPEPFEEGKVKADTLWLLPENELAILCYRAQIPTCDDEASDITHLLAVWERPGAAPADRCVLQDVPEGTAGTGNGSGSRGRKRSRAQSNRGPRSSRSRCRGNPRIRSWRP